MLKLKFEGKPARIFNELLYAAFPWTRMPADSKHQNVLLSRGRSSTWSCEGLMRFPDVGVSMKPLKPKM